MKGNKGRKNKKRIIYIKNILTKKLKAMYLLEVVYLLSMYLILEKVVNTVFSGLLHVKGYSYLTAEMMGEFFSGPLVILGVLALIFVICILVTFFHLFICEYVEQVIVEKKTSFIRVCRESVERCMRLWKRRPIALLVLITEVVLYHNLSSLLLAGAYLPKVNYILRAWLKLPYTKEICGILMISMGIFYFRYFFTLPFLMYENNSLTYTKKKSVDYWKQNYKKALGGWAVVQILTVCVTVILYLLLVFLAIFTISVFVPVSSKIAVFCTVREDIRVVVFWFAMLFGSTVQTVVCSGNFHLNQKERLHLEQVTEKETLLHPKLLAAVLVVILCMDVVISYDNVQKGKDEAFLHVGEFTITSHRGASWSAPENTIPAIEKAIEEGADYVEIDVQETMDGEIVLMHDTMMTRTTGLNKKVSQVTCKEIQKLDAGSWFSEDYKGTKVPTLDEVLALCKGKIQLNIEIKAGKDMPDLEQKVMELIHEHDFVRQCVITSMYKSSLRKVKKIDREIRTGYILSSAYGRYYLDEEIDFLSMRSSIIDERVVRMAHTYGKMVCAWTVNSKAEAIRMKQLGVDNIITDKPFFVRNALYEEEGSSVVVRLLKLSF